jgi:hypothetical protein
VTSDGRAWLSVGTHLRTWRVDGSVSDQVVLPKPIIRAWCIDDHHVIAATEDQHYLVDVDTPDRFAPTVRMAASGPIRLAEGLAVALLVGGGIALLDTTANVWWPVARFAARTATIAGDDNALIAIAGQGYDFWSLDLPRSPEATVAWIDAITNATYDTATGALVWHGVVLQPRR